MKTRLSLLFLVFVCACNAQQTENATGSVIVFRHVNIIPMDKEVVLEDHDVVISNHTITAIGKSGSVQYSNDAQVIDAAGKYIMPGLAEMHAHVPPVDDIEPMKKVLTLFIANGVTTIRGMLGHPRHLQLRSKIMEGEIIGPRFYTSGPSFNGNSVKTPEVGVTMVKQQKEAGYDFLKFHPGLTLENFNAIVQTAKEVNIPFAGHVSADVGVWRAIDAGYASIDHMDGFVEALIPGYETLPDEQKGLFAIFAGYKADTSKIPALMKALKDHHIWVVPTQSLAERWFTPTKTADELSKEPEMIYMDSESLNNWINQKNDLAANSAFNKEHVLAFISLRRKLIYECNKNGVGLLLGSDAPQVFDVPGFSVQHELHYLVESGLTPYEALKTGTVNPATYFNRSDFGVIKQDNIADLILLSGNPLKNIDEIKNIEGVVVNGKWLSKTEISNELEKLKRK